MSSVISSTLASTRLSTLDQVLASLDESDALDESSLMMKKRSLTKRGCTTAQLYLSPESLSTFDASSGPITFKWDKTCISSSKINLKLFAPNSADPTIKIWESIDASTGSLSEELLPRWWNSTTSIGMQIIISPSGSLIDSVFSSLPVGPQFTVTYPESALVTTTVGGSTVAAPAANTAISDPVVVKIGTGSGSLPAGSIFAAVFFPIVVIVAGIFIYVRWTRAKQAKKRQRWSQAIDNRMSVLSNAWQPGTGQGESPRKSEAFSQNRRTVMSTYSNHAGFGTHQAGQPDMSEIDPASFARPRTMFTDAERNSRAVSFAEPGARSSTDQNRATHYSSRTQGSIYSRRSDPHEVPTQAHHASGHAKSKSSLSGILRPRVDMGNHSEARRGNSLELSTSPSQTSGPWVLGVDEVDRFGQQRGQDVISEDQENLRDVPESNVNPSKNQLPRLQIPSKAANPTILSPSLTPTSACFPGPPPAVSIDPSSASPMSPDDMLKAYAAARNRSASVSQGQPSVGQAWEEADRRSVVGENNPFRASMVGSDSEFGSK
ncbi:hypothetical protein [Phaffia rhodozyma]|uniref:Uncharacterized protein n=1 Tax=Phaffia rhodozyma TaxID=264483 RepID=A0A0F7SSA1_PHARH|nr:hypothetical protein [Phaffia rhodozyma]